MTEVREEFIYFIRGAGLTKIGVTCDVHTRFIGIRSISPVPVEIIKIIPGDRSLERRLHHHFKRYRDHGEWFALPEGWEARVDRQVAEMERRRAIAAAAAEPVAA